MVKKNEIKSNLPMILIILDGWGIAEPNKGNAIFLAKTPNLDNLSKNYPYTELRAHGKYVGLQSEQDGNSEAGHMNIGSGRIVEQDVVKIGRSINEGIFFKNTALVEAIRHVKKNKSHMHLMGMLSNGMSAHSHPDHILALIELMKKSDVKNVFFHLFTDGRDSPKYSGLKLVEDIKRSFKNGEVVATIMGRFYAMDRKKKWERTEQAYNALVLGEGLKAENSQAAITESYNKGDNDEFIKPYIIYKKNKQTPRINDNDSVIFFNLRSDRARQLAKVFAQKKFNEENPNSFSRKKLLKNLYFVAMTDFGPDLDSIKTAYPSADLKNTLPVVLSDLTQLYITETEKRAHITYFFNGGYSGKVDGEDHFIIFSPDVKFYDEVPAMKSKELADVVINNLRDKKYNFTVLNFPAPDMIGHTGNLKAGIKCCEVVDREVGRIVNEYLSKNGTIIITADHGNIEEMINLKTDEIDSEHSTNLVPFIIVNDNLKKKIKLKENGILSDISPTILDLMEKQKPAEMHGKSLIK